MEVIQCNNLKENRDKLIEVKNLDPEFSYNFKDDRLFFLVSKNRIYGYSIVKLNENAIDELTQIKSNIARYEMENTRSCQDVLASMVDNKTKDKKPLF